MMRPSFEQLVGVIHLLVGDEELVAVNLILVDPAGRRKWLNVAWGTQARDLISARMIDGYVPLGLLAWRREPEGWAAQKLLFPWFEDDPAKARWFARICNSAVDSVAEVAETYTPGESK